MPTKTEISLDLFIEYEFKDEILMHGAIERRKYAKC